MPILDLLAPPTCAACRRPAQRSDMWRVPAAAAVAARAPLPALRAAAASLRLPGGGRRVRPRVGAAGLRGRGARHRARAQVRRRAPARRADGGAHGRQPPRRPARAAARAASRSSPSRRTAAGCAGGGSTPRRCSRAGSPSAPGCRSRRASGAPTGGAGRSARAARCAAARAASRRWRPSAPPRAVVLVDDVHTTGATLDACAHALKERGAEWVGAATYVRTL